MSFHPPLSRIAGRYEVASRPLQGGMGVVYLCYDHTEGRPVALKTFKAEYLPDREARDRFLREGSTWVELGRHPHVVHAYGVERVGDGREVYLVLEQIAKEQGRTDASLRSWLTPGHPLPAAESLLIALQIVRALKHASERIEGFVHRDLKPENVLVGADRLSGWAFNRVRVTDFGLAAILQGLMLPKGDVDVDVRQTQLTHGWVGTPLYMAPEQWAGEPLSAQTDMYALGLMLYEMLHGERAVAGRSLKEFEQAHRSGALRPWRVGVPSQVRVVVDTCLRLAAGERYRSWGEVEHVLAGAYVDISGQAVPAAETQRALARDERVALGWAQSALGLSYLDIGKAEAAVVYFTRTRDVGVVEADKRLASAGLNHLGLAYAALGDARQAIEYYEQALVIDREIADRHGEGVALGNLGQAYADLGDARRAINLTEQHLAISRSLGDRSGEGHALGNLGSVYADLGDARQAIRYYDQQLAITREIHDQRGEGQTSGSLGNAYLQLGDARQAVGYYEQALSIHRAIGNRRAEGADVCNLGTAYRQLNDPRRAMGCFDQALAIAREIGDKHGEGIALNNVGTAYRHLGDARQAIGYHEQALDLAREIGNRIGEGNALGNLGQAHADLRNTREAIQYLEQGLTISCEIGNRDGEATTLGNLGNVYLLLDDAPRAIGYMERYLIVAREIGDRHGQGLALSNLGSAYAVLGDPRRAIEYLDQALTIRREIDDIDGMATDMFKMAVLYLRQDDQKSAVPLVQAAAGNWAQIGSPNAKRAEQLAADIASGTAVGNGPAPEQLLQNFGPLIDGVVAVARGNVQSQAPVQAFLQDIEQEGWHIAGPIQQIWAGERDRTVLISGLDDSDTLIITAILKRLT